MNIQDATDKHLQDELFALLDLVRDAGKLRQFEASLRAGSIVLHAYWLKEVDVGDIYGTAYWLITGQKPVDTYANAGRDQIERQFPHRLDYIEPGRRYTALENWLMTQYIFFYDSTARKWLLDNFEAYKQVQHEPA